MDIALPNLAPSKISKKKRSLILNNIFMESQVKVGLMMELK